MVLCTLTVDLDAYTGAETLFLLLIRFLSLNLYWNPSQAIIHMRMVYLLWAYISFFLGKPHHFHFKNSDYNFRVYSYEKMVKKKNGCSNLTQSIKSCWTSRWLDNLKDWIIVPWHDVENPFAGGEMWVENIRKDIFVECWQAGRRQRSTSPPPRLCTHITGCHECHISGGHLRARGDRSPITGW